MRPVLAGVNHKLLKSHCSDRPFPTPKKIAFSALCVGIFSHSEMETEEDAPPICPVFASRALKKQVKAGPGCQSNTLISFHAWK